MSPLALADRSADAVNERIPVEKAALEQHWSVDCTAAWNRFRSRIAQPPPDRPSEGALALQRELQLCAYIYQAPGEETDHRFPDYRDALGQLEQEARPAD